MYKRNKSEKINDAELFNIKLRFQHLKNKNILIYGTGINTKLLIEALPDFNIVGILDRSRYEGDIQKIPIITWDEVTKNTAEVIIIASKTKNFREIFLRIRHYGEIFDMDIYDFLGQNLSSKFYYADYTYEEMECLKFSKQDLFDMIDKYDAISFDLFDTLIMRKVLEPDDIFDIVERKIHKYGIYICDFKKKRRTAELNSNGADIFVIYKELKKIINISDNELSLIMEEELTCEKANIIPRYDMVEIFNYALEKGKIVSIISNMYLPYNIVQDILENVGIKGYHYLLISCEYDKAKSQGLFEVYRKKIGSNIKYLHIGDNYIEDILSAEKNGIATFYINSSLELLKRSKMRTLLLNAHDFENRLLIGLIISKLFNNPFILYNTSCYVPVSSVKIFVEVFIAPVVYMYMKKLLDCIHENQYDGIIFSARDGFLFYYLYNKYRKKIPNLPHSYYITISKKKYANYVKNLTIDSERKYLFCELVFTDISYYTLTQIFNQKFYGFYLGGISLLPELNNMVTYVYPCGLKNNIISRADLLEIILSSTQPFESEINGDGDIFYESEEKTDHEINILINIHKYVEEFIKEFECICEDLELTDLSLLDNLLALIDGIKIFGDIEFLKKINITKRV